MKTHKILLAVITALFAVGANAQVDPGTANLTHSWTFNDGTANDHIGGAHGVLMGDSYIEAGSLFTDLGEAWMEMPADIISINSYSEITLEIWFIPLAVSNTGFHMIAFFGDSQNSLGVNYYFLTPARGDDASRAGISCGNTSTPWSAESYAAGPELDDGALHHMVSTLNGSEITLYIDGVLQQADPLDTNNSIDRISNAFAYLAKGGYVADDEWKGEILEFNIYSKALSADEVLFLYNKGATAVQGKKEDAIPAAYNLSQNYPNPFNPTTTISFSLPNSAFVSLKVYNMLGKEVGTLVNGVRGAGTHSVQFNASNISSGVYFYTLHTENFTETKKMLLLR